MSLVQGAGAERPRKAPQPLLQADYHQLRLALKALGIEVSLEQIQRAGESGALRIFFHPAARYIGDGSFKASLGIRPGA